MFNSPVLDLVILLSFVYFIGSLILSAINESIAGALRLRQTELRRGLYKFFFDPTWKNFVKTRLLKSPHIQTLMKKRDRVPAYIPAKNFVSALLQNAPKDYIESGFEDAKDLPKDAKEVLQDIWKRIPSGTDASIKMKEFESRLEEFYNSTMDRVTGWYKRRIRKLLLAIGIPLAIILNLDTIKIANDALKDPDKLSKAVDNISANISKIDTLNNLVIQASSDTVKTFRLQAVGDSITKLTIIFEKTSGFSLGYKDRNDFREQWSKGFWKKLLGILLTAFALQLGSNYWFELMTKAVNIRAAGKRPEEKPKETKTT